MECSFRATLFTKVILAYSVSSVNILMKSLMTGKTQHGLALCYKVSKVNIIEVIDIPSTGPILTV